ncbi:sarcoplasmic reticulum histidine-rich calcium-binding protein-like isoform X2 [Sycon ciliatum]|uniref:sarcoplasmic reticulum histidine-rich calcium-binding protein-like isoform X2 n=1 Tax=Sycon ciliatum TaxID=27933 RepID=UPI0020ACE180|eukprot:scpid29757/ scgid30644/ Sarcoplasmic reticulum histidine-rich calcium-binding protein
MASKSFSVLAIFAVLCLVYQLPAVCSEPASEAPDSKPIEQPDAAKEPAEKTTKEPEFSSPEYAKNSFCGYCKYCKFCDLCGTDCPCEDKRRVGCDMCKYCNFCAACKLCDTFCQAGGIIDRFSSHFFEMLGGVDLDKVDKELAADPKIKEYL